MKKIPCLFVRVFDGPRKSTLTDEITFGCEWVMSGEGTASRKWDGTACTVIDGRLYKRYDAKAGKMPPVNGIPCQDPDPITGHWPHWIPIDYATSNDRWHIEAWGREVSFADGTYELVGPKINGNPEQRAEHVLIRHGADVMDVPRTKDGIRVFLESNRIEGIVFAHPDGRMCKIRRADFGFSWP
jgi:hypothetical protein